MTVEEYLKASYAKGNVDHVLTIFSTSESGAVIYIHPSNKDGETMDFMVQGDEIKRL